MDEEDVAITAMRSFCRGLQGGQSQLTDVLTGASSAGEYAVMAREPIQSFYCSNLDRLGYKVVAEAKYMQWKKRIDLHGQDREIKVDLLVGPLGQFRERKPQR